MSKETDAIDVIKKYMGRKSYSEFTSFEKLAVSVHSISKTPEAFVDLMKLFISQSRTKE